MSQLKMELNSPSDNAQGISITLMYSKTSKKILFVEAGKDFVDLVMGFLTLPIGYIIKLLSESALVTPKAVGGIANVFVSIQRLEDEEKMCANKKMLIDPRPTYDLGSKYLVVDSNCGPSDGDATELVSQNYFACGAIPHCTYVSPRYGAKCPRHQRKMTTQCKLIEGHDSTSHGYVKDGSKFFVTDNLEIFPSSNSLAVLKKLNVENMSSLDSLDIHVGTDEVLQLLRASLTSGNVLSDVFGKALQDMYVLAPLREILSKADSISYLSNELLRSLEKGNRLKAAMNEMSYFREREQKLYSAMREIDFAFQTNLIMCVEEREQTINSTLKKIDRSTNNTSCTNSDSLGSQSLFFFKLDGVKERDFQHHSSAHSRDRVDDHVEISPSKEMLMLERQIDKVMEKLIALGSYGLCLEPPLTPKKHKPSVKPPWTLLQMPTQSRIYSP